MLRRRNYFFFPVCCLTCSGRDLVLGVCLAQRRQSHLGSCLAKQAFICALLRNGIGLVVKWFSCPDSNRDTRDIYPLLVISEGCCHYITGEWWGMFLTYWFRIYYMIRVMTIKEQCTKLRFDNPHMGYKRIAKIVGCCPSNVEYHLKPSTQRLTHLRASKNRQIVKDCLKRMFGGKCVRCGYDKCLSSLHFHHLPQFKKVAGVSALLNLKGREAVITEAKKCILICANCHGELHQGMWVP